VRAGDQHRSAPSQGPAASVRVAGGEGVLTHSARVTPPSTVSMVPVT